MTQVTPQDTFNALLSFFKNPQNENYLSLLSVPTLLSAEGQEKFIKVKHIAIKIMESGIFCEGGLSAIYSADPVPIRDLDQFIYDLAYLLLIYEEKVIPDYPFEYQSELFFRGIEHLEMFTTGVRLYKGRRAAQPFKRVLKTLKQFEQETQVKPDSPPPVSLPKLKREIADIFCEHIQATKEILSTRIAELLNAFDISASPEGMREYFKGK